MLESSHKLSRQGLFQGKECCILTINQSVYFQSFSLLLCVLASVVKLFSIESKISLF